jgi:ABC-2 type transport system ATP-binding protein
MTTLSLPDPSIGLKQVNLSYGERPVLRSLDWQLLQGQVVGLLGRNAAGKTTLLETALGLREPQAGTVQLFGVPVTAIGDADRARIGYVPQQADIFEGFTPFQLLAYFRSFYPRWNEAKVQGLMSRWEIPWEQPIARLSGGQQQRLSIIRALAHEPDLLVLDEPVSSLDPAGRRDFLGELVEQVLDRGTTVVLSTHRLSDLERVAFDVAFLRDGRIGMQAPLDELIEHTRQVSGTQQAIDAFIARTGAKVLGKPAVAQTSNATMLLRLPPGTTIQTDPIDVQSVNLETLFMELA